MRNIALVLMISGSVVQAMYQAGEVDLNRLEQGDLFKGSSLHGYFEEVRQKCNECEEYILRNYKDNSNSFIASCYYNMCELAGASSQVPHKDIHDKLLTLYQAVSREDWNEKQRKLNNIDDIQDAEIMRRIALKESNSKQVIVLLNHLYQMELVLKNLNNSVMVPYATFNRFAHVLSNHISEYKNLYNAYLEGLITPTD